MKTSRPILTVQVSSSLLKVIRFRITTIIPSVLQSPSLPLSSSLPPSSFFNALSQSRQSTYYSYSFPRSFSSSSSSFTTKSISISIPTIQRQFCSKMDDKEPTTTTTTCNGDEQHDDKKVVDTNGTKANENDKRPISSTTATATTESESATNDGEPETKKSKRDRKPNGSNYTGYNVNVDGRLKVPTGGSFAHPDLRKQFGIELDESKISLPDDTPNTVKRKVAIFMGFLGTNYGGFQANPTQRTIQAELELALYRAGIIGKYNFGHPGKYGFSMSARTDRGVHACAQLVSLKAEILDTDVENLEGVRQRIEQHLPTDIRLFDIVRTTRAFCAKTARDRVRYQYMIPSFLLHPDYVSVLKECNIPMEGRKDTAKAPLTKDEVVTLQTTLKEFRSTPEQRSRLQQALARYKGTHPFHNFTKGIKRGQASANRFIEYFQIQDPIIINNVEWIPTQVLGQSFLLHQIRKMVSMAIDVARGAAPISVMDQALSKDPKIKTIRVHVAPAQGLFLEMSYYNGYNRRKPAEVPKLDLTVSDSPSNHRWSAFRDQIRAHIVEEEEKEGNFIQYFYMQECIFEYRRFYRLDGNTEEDDNFGGEAQEEDDDVNDGDD